MGEVIEISFYIVLVIIGITQVVIPSFSNKLPFFWLFRKSNIKKLMEARQKLEETELEIEADAIRKKARDKSLDSIMNDIKEMEVEEEDRKRKQHERTKETAD